MKHVISLLKKTQNLLENKKLIKTNTTCIENVHNLFLKDSKSNKNVKSAFRKYKNVFKNKKCIQNIYNVSSNIQNL